MNVEQARFNMIEQQIRPWDVLDAHVLDLLAVVRREDFVPAAHRALAFADLEIPLKDSDAAVAAGQVMLAPRVEARMLQDLQVAKHEKVLEIGTGSGFMAALLAAARVRLRPILMTTLAMVFGMVPLAFAVSEGSEQRAPMGQAVIGGVITSSLLTLVVVPVVYCYLDDLAGWFKRRLRTSAA